LRVRRESSQLRFRLFAIEAHSAVQGRVFYSPGELDLDNELEGVERALTTATWEYLGAKQIPVEGRRDPRPVSHGYRSYRDLFFPRQVLGLDLLSRSLDWESLSDREALAATLVISDLAGNNSRLCNYAIDWFKQSPSFGLHAYRPPTRPVEGNFVGSGLGRGSFEGVTRKVARAFDAIRPNLPDTSRVVATLAASKVGDIIDPEREVVLYTDPPYFDFLDYADLSDFFYQVQLAVRPDIRPALPAHVHHPDDLSIIATQSRSATHFGAALAASLRPFAENPKFKLGVLHFHHSSPSGWAHLDDALRDAELSVAHVAFERSEFENGYHSKPGNAKLDALFYLTNRATPRDPAWPSLTSELRRVQDRLGPLRDSDARVVAGALSVVHGNRKGQGQHGAYLRLQRGLLKRAERHRPSPPSQPPLELP
jgi:putative DNA methylase